MRSARSLVTDPRVFDAVVAALMAALLLGAYITAYAYVIQANVIEPIAGLGYGIVLAAWLGATGLLFAAFGAGLRAGKPWDRALPDGYIGSLAAALIFGAAWIVDNGYWAKDIVGANALGLDARATLHTLLSYPFHLIRLGAYWKRIEPEPTRFDTAELDWQIDAAEQAGSKPLE